MGRVVRREPAGLVYGRGKAVSVRYLTQSKPSSPGVEELRKENLIRSTVKVCDSVAPLLNQATPSAEAQPTQLLLVRVMPTYSEVKGVVTMPVAHALSTLLTVLRARTWLTPPLLARKFMALPSVLPELNT